MRPSRAGGQYRAHGRPITVAGSTGPNVRESVDCAGSSPRTSRRPSSPMPATRFTSQRDGSRGSGTATRSDGHGRDTGHPRGWGASAEASITKGGQTAAR